MMNTILKYLVVGYSIFASITLNAQQMRVATFNIKQENTTDVGNLWNDRREALCNMIKFHDFEIFGTQEGFNGQVEYMKAHLPGYDYVGVGRDNGQKEGEYSAIFFDSERFEVKESGTFWLSDTDTGYPNKGWDAALPRICTWGIFVDKENQKAFIFMNTHFDHVGVEARRESAKQILAKAKEFAEGLPLILTGDFNIDQHNEAYHTLAKSGIVTDAYDLAESKYIPSSTFNGWGKTKKVDERIDHIFVTSQFDVRKYGVLTDTFAGKYLSDHFPVVVTLDWK